MGLNFSVISAVFRRNFVSYFANPVGYLFIFAFALTAAYFAFNDQFFASNLADLDQLNAVYALLALLLVPAITMSVWAEERRSGTEELLLTLPGSDLSIVLGKYFACVGIYTAALAFSTILIMLLAYLGDPDPGLIVSTYIGYWLIGCALLAAGMAASLLTSHTTVAFILGLLVCGVLVGVARVGDIVNYGSNLLASIGWIKADESGETVGGSFVKEFLPRLSIEGSFLSAFGRGVMTLSAFWYFLSVTLVMLYLNVFLLGRRHWSGGEKAPRQWAHGVIRTVSLLVAAVALYVFARRADSVAFVDATSERLHALSDQTLQTLRNIPDGKQVRIEAFLSPVKELPKEYVEVHRNLRDKLLQYEAQGRGRISLTIHETELYSPEAVRAEKNFKIRPVEIHTQEEGRFRSTQFILGVNVVSGQTEISVPFFHKGLPVEYELTRLVRSASEKELPQIAVLSTGADILSPMQEEGDWLIVNDLKKQYKVIRATPGQLFQREEKAPTDNKDAPPSEPKIKRNAEGEPILAEALKDVKCLIVPMPSTLRPGDLREFLEYVKSGRPTLILEDAACLFNTSLSSASPPPPNMMGGMPPPPGRNLNVVKQIGDLLGVEFSSSKVEGEDMFSRMGRGEPKMAPNVIWQLHNPLRQSITTLPLEIVASGVGVTDDVLYDKEHPITQSMQGHVQFLFPGGMKRRGGDGPKVTALLKTTPDAGTLPAAAVHEQRRGERDFSAKRQRQTDEFILAAAIEGKPADVPDDEPPLEKDAAKKPPAKNLKVVIIADCDFMSDEFFRIRQMADKNLDFENIGFLVNCVDYLAGDESLIALRQKRPKRRTLEEFMKISKAFENEAKKDEDVAREKAKSAEDAAQKEYDTVRRQLENRSSVKMQEIVEVAQKLQVEQRKLERAKTEINQELRDKVRDSQQRTQEKVRQKQLAIRFLAYMLPAIPVLLLGLAVFSVRRSRETEGLEKTRLV